MYVSGVFRVGVIGLGSMGRNHLRVLQHLIDAEPVATYDPINHGGDGLPHYTDFEAFLDQGLDYAVVAAPTDSHFDLGCRLVEHGTACLIEKPLAGTSSDATALADIFASHSVALGVGHVERHNTAVQQARLRLQQGLIGEVIQYASIRQGPFPGRIRDVGVALDLATHDIDVVSFLQGQPYASVSCVSQFISGGAHEDSLVAVGRLGDGTAVNHVVNWMSPFKERRLVILGTKGALVVDTLGSDLIYYENAAIEVEWDDLAHFRGMVEGNVTRLAFSKKEPLVEEHLSFQARILGKPSDIADGKAGALNVAVAEAFLESSRVGGQIGIC